MCSTSTLPPTVKCVLRLQVVQPATGRDAHPCPWHRREQRDLWPRRRRAPASPPVPRPGPAGRPLGNQPDHQAKLRVAVEHARLARPQPHVRDDRRLHTRGRRYGHGRRRCRRATAQVAGQAGGRPAASPSSISRTSRRAATIGGRKGTRSLASSSHSQGRPRPSRTCSSCARTRGNTATGPLSAAATRIAGSECEGSPVRRYACLRGEPDDRART